MTHERDASLGRVRFVALALAVALAAPGATIGGGGSSAAIDGSVRVSPLLVTLVLSASTAKLGETVKAEARVTNLGTSTLKGIGLELRADRVGLAIHRPFADVSQLKPGKSTAVSWTVCSRSAGSYVLLVRASIGGLAMDSPAQLLQILPSSRKTCS